MKKYLVVGISLLIFQSCMNGQAQNEKFDLSVADFAAKIKQDSTALIIDVRTPEEFIKGHLENAVNYKWNGNEFDQQIANLDKSKAVFVYCLSGGRSSSAADKMRSDGFKQVYEMDGGMMKWRSENLPETTANTVKSKGMSKQQFDSLLVSDKLILIDFYADWCAPCVKMKPYLEEISKDLANSVVVIRINADENPALCKELKIDGLPVLQLYKNKILTWSNIGFIEKSEVLKNLK
jgi:thioredoxin 1